MKTMFEEIKKRPAKYIKFGVVENLSEAIDTSEMFLVDNVSDFWWGSEQDEWHFSDFPNIAPPFERFFMEYRSPKIVHIEGEYSENTIYNGKWGLLFISQKQEGGWLYNVLFFTQDGESLKQFRCFAAFAIDNSGKYIPEIPGSRGGFRVGIDKTDKLLNSIDIDSLSTALWQYMCPCLLAISFLHCKNVSVINNDHREHGKRNKHNPSIAYKTLSIEPMKKTLISEDGMNDNGLKRAMHICRGHFKDFSDKGLFGKLHGIYWWESQVRGKVENGMVIKDYSVNPPREQP